MPPKSPVAGVTSPLLDVILLPMGATDLRISEFPTTTESIKTDDTQHAQNWTGVCTVSVKTDDVKSDYNDNDDRMGPKF